MDNLYFFFQQTLYFVIPLMIVALGGMFSEKSGII
ncbi:MAG: ABC transporter permease, partial [Bacilli bacterium]|nr:ABC transporter permease [Bacilli bacterium]